MTAAVLVAAVLTAAPVAAQHEHHHPPADTAEAVRHGEQHAMPPRPLGLPMTRDGSGTSWLPDASPMEMLHGAAGGWSLMAHGNVFLQYLRDGGDRGHDQLGSINWVMGMAERPLLGGSFAVRGMLSAEPLTVGDCGYPDLLATGETCEGGRPIVDQQHPHDLFMELGARWSRALGDAVAVELYGAAAGEPALGPVAYAHRPSSLANPIAPIGHHWMDATHIAFGVVTAGVYGRGWKVEGSVFNGREPDEERYGIDLAPLDSYAGRLTLAPTDRLVVQVSGGHLEEAEPPHADEHGHVHDETRVDVDRYTASLIHHWPLAGDGFAAATLAFGRNVEHGLGSNALLAEGAWGVGAASTWFGRVEVVEKPASKLVLAGPDPDALHPVGKLTIGYTRTLLASRALAASIGVMANAGIVPSALEPTYGDRLIPGLGLYLRLHPPAARSAGDGEHEGQRDHGDHGRSPPAGLTE